jgi:hypothetical protein
VLVHCAAGAYRAGGVMASYRILFQGWSPKRAKREMMSFGVESSDNLPEHLNQYLPVIARRLKTSGVLKQVPKNLDFRA